MAHHRKHHKEVIESLYAELNNVAAVGRRIGVTKQRAHEIFRNLGIEIYYETGPRKQARALVLFQSGKTLAEIAYSMRLTERQIRVHLRRCGYSFRLGSLRVANMRPSTFQTERP